MKTTTLALLVLNLASLGARAAHAQDAAHAQAAPPVPSPEALPPPLPGPPSAPPAPSTDATPSPPPDDANAVPDGQWVYTNLYGWVWMPYDALYSYLSPSSSIAYQYVYYPTFGWQWITSPWLLGYGPLPYWGPRGYARYGWVGHPEWVPMTRLQTRGWVHNHPHALPRVEGHGPFAGGYRGGFRGGGFGGRGFGGGHRGGGFGGGHHR